MRMLGVWIAALAILVGGYFLGPGSDPAPVPDPQPNGPTSPVPVEPVGGGETTPIPVPEPEPTKPMPPTEDGITEIADIYESMKGQHVVTRGYVTDISGGKGHVFFYFKDVNGGKEIKGVLFKEENYDNEGRKALVQKSLADGSAIYVDGRVDVYKGELEVIAKKIYQ